MTKQSAVRRSLSSRSAVDLSLRLVPGIPQTRNAAGLDASLLVAE